MLKHDRRSIFEEVTLISQQAGSTLIVNKYKDDKK